MRKQNPKNAASKGLHVITTGYEEQHREHRHDSSKPLMGWVLASRSLFSLGDCLDQSAVL
ncbi:MAG: hypothetical protein V2I48_07795 [Xanthomonadales bacterium]|jgi:hypothetical protein|nr:hypothetical protein [Xanthomonadales bacterium]